MSLLFVLLFTDLREICDRSHVSINYVFMYGTKKKNKSLRRR